MTAGGATDAEARKLADAWQESVTAVVIGAGEPAVNLAHYGADRIVLARHELLSQYSTEGFCRTLIQVVKQAAPGGVIGAATAMGRDLLPRVAAGLGVVLAQDCTEIRSVNDKQLECVRPIYAGKAFARVRPTMAPAMATLRPNVFSLGCPDASRSADTRVFTPDLDPAKIRARAVAVQAAAGGRIELTEADIIVSGGRGVKGPEYFPMIQDLADAPFSPASGTNSSIASSVPAGANASPTAIAGRASIPFPITSSGACTNRSRRRCCIWCGIASRSSMPATMVRRRTSTGC